MCFSSDRGSGTVSLLLHAISLPKLDPRLGWALEFLGELLLFFTSPSPVLLLFRGLFTEGGGMEIGSLDLFAREGRELQRYDENQFRLVAGCIPYKLVEKVGNNDDLGSRLLVLMISTPNRHDLVFPKGGWEKDESREEAACREAFEEAGVRGNLREVLGVWTFRSKSSESAHSQVGFCKGSMFALEVTTEFPTWPEQHSHQRVWLTMDKAWELCRYQWMREALTRCVELLSEEAALQVKPEGRCTELSENECIENPINALC